MKYIYTIGYSNYTPDEFYNAINRYEINAIADVRTTPYSAYHPAFNKEVLEAFLVKKGVKYVFLGVECGARPNETECYINGKLDINLISRNKQFKKGLNRILNGSNKFNIALM